MSIDQITHEAYMEVLRTESAKILAQVKNDTEASLNKSANYHAVDAYKNVMNLLLKIPEGIKKEIQEAQKRYWPEGGNKINMLNMQLWFIKKAINTNISTATIQVSVINLAQQNGANVSEMLESIKNSSALIKSECEKLFQ